MRDWTVGGAVIEGPGAAVLMVRNLRRNGTYDWTPPGGVIDGDEGVVAGLSREVREETGLEVLTWAGPLYSIVAAAPGLGWNLRVEVHRAVQVVGDLVVGDDPDGIVVEAEWVAPDLCAARLTDAHPWVREPLLEWLDERWVGHREFGYLVEGTEPGDLRVERVA